MYTTFEDERAVYVAANGEALVTATITASASMLLLQKTDSGPITRSTMVTGKWDGITRNGSRKDSRKRARTAILAGKGALVRNTFGQ